MLEGSGVGNQTRHLDLGCGTGGLCAMAAARGARTAGMDASQNMIGFAQRRYPDIEFKVGELEQPPYDDGSFDVVTAQNSVQFAEDRVTALRRAKRLLMPGGKFCIGMWSEPERNDMTAAFDAMMELAPPPGKDSPASISTKESLLSLLTEAGFKPGEVVEVAVPFHYSSMDEAIRGVRAAGLAEIVAQKAGEDALHGSLTKAFRDYTAQDGSVHLDNHMRCVVCT
jgi:ubiquinone/menaquinone biosynthesis C-methylase UbiE